MNNSASPIGNWSYPTSIRFGAGRISELPDACVSAGVRRPLFVTDRALANMPMTRRAAELLTAAGLGDAVFAEVDPNPTECNLAAAVQRFIERECDGVVAFGGGSSLDLGKLTAFMVRQTHSVWDFEDIGDYWRRADAAAIYPVVAVPTTAGTGSEVGRAGVLVDSQKKEKKIIFHPKMLAASVICDAELLVNAPLHIIAGAGMDAFAHCLEAYCSPHYHPMSQGIALEGMRLALQYLPHAFCDSDNLAALAHMMSAASMGAVAFQKGLGAVHALSHPIGAMYNTHHGMTNAVVLPAVLRFNRSAIESRLAAAAAYLGIAGGFDGFYESVCELRHLLKVPENLRELGVDSNADLDVLAAMAAKDPSVGGNPLPLDVNALRQLFEECM